MDKSEIEMIVRVLRRVQSEECLSLKGLAQRLGFSAGHLSMIYSGKRRPGVRFLRALIAHYPELRTLLAQPPARSSRAATGSPRRRAVGSPGKPGPR